MLEEWSQPYALSRFITCYQPILRCPAVSVTHHRDVFKAFSGANNAHKDVKARYVLASGPIDNKCPWMRFNDLLFAS